MFRTILILWLATAAGFFPVSAQEPAKRISSGVQEYGQWKGFAPGSWSKYQMAERDAAKTTKAKVATYTLTAVETNKVSLKYQTIDTAADGKSSTNTTTFHLNPMQTASSVRQQIQEGDEELTLGARKLKCHWSEVNSERTSREGKKITWVYRIWLSPEVPGGMVKSMNTMKDGGNTISSGEIKLLAFESK